MTPQTKIRIAIVALALIAAVVATREIISTYRIGRLEKTIEAQNARADDLEKIAFAKELEAAMHLRKNEHLESRLAKIREIAKKQDEDIESKTSASRAARASRDRIRSERTGPTTASELCKNLAEIGYGC